MNRFLRDEQVKNRSLNEDKLRKINDVFVEIAKLNNAGLPDTDEGKKKWAMVNYIIRFDNKGFMIHDFDTFLKYLNGAKKIERVIFILDSNESYLSNAKYGKNAELRFDVKDENNCFLRVQDDSSDWVDLAFCKIAEEIAKYKNRNFIIRNAWTPFAVQVFGVISGFILSLWAALRVSPHLSLEYSFVVVLILAFLIFSNVWTYLNQIILKMLDYLFPNISFSDSKGLHWALKCMVTAFFVAIAFFLVNKALAYIGLLLEEIIK